MKILIDTREKQPWDFSFANDCTDMTVCTIKTGDYSIEGYQDKVAIERKKTVDELALNLGSKYKQFEAEMERMSVYEYRYVVCEFSLSDIINYPDSSNLSAKIRSQLRLTGKFMLKRINDLMDKYDINFIYANSREEAEQTVLDIFRQITNGKN